MRVASGDEAPARLCWLRLVGITVGAVFALLRALLYVPTRLLGTPAPR